MTSRGLVSVDGEPRDDVLFPNPFNATGLPVTEAYWASVLAGGAAGTCCRSASSAAA